MISLSILDYSPVDENTLPEEALSQTVRLAQLAEKLGYRRFWVSEHHRIPSVAGSTPELLMMHLADRTSAIRIGSGGVMLPNYSPYKVAENFRMLEALHPGRIDLGIGSATGGGRLATKAVKAGRREVPHDQQTADLLGFLSGRIPDSHPFSKLTVSPEISRSPDIWLLGTSESSAERAAEHGAAYAYAHFARPEGGVAAAKKYRMDFSPSPFRKDPKVMPAVFVIVAETALRAEELAKAFDLWLFFVETPNSPPYYPSAETAGARGTSAKEREKIERNRQRAIVGDPESVKQQLKQLAADYETDEIMVMPHIAGTVNRERAITLLAEAFRLS